jgi:hypothetical protein
MAPEYVDRFVALVFAGGGLFVAGLINLFGSMLGDRIRLTLTALVCAVAIGGGAAWSGGDWTVTRLIAAVVVGGMLIGLVLGSGLLPSVARTFGSIVTRSSVRWGLLTVAGLAVVASASAVYDFEDAAQVYRDTDAMLGEFDDPAKLHIPVTPNRLTTDQGTAVELTECPNPRPASDLVRMERQSIRKSGHADFIMRLHPADDRSNCFGWVFTGGQYYIDGRQVDRILEENSYQAVADPKPGDLVVYRWQGLPTHMAIVRYVSEGQPVLIEGKWGWEGVYLHPVTKSNFGNDFTYYRSPRGGHLLRQSADPAGAKADARTAAGAS